MKVLFIVPEYPPHYGGGIATFYKNLLPLIVQQSCQVDVLVGSAFSSKLSSYEKDGIKVSFLDTNLVNTYLHKFNCYKAIPELQRHLAAAWALWEQANRGEEYDLVEVTDWGMLFVPWIVSENSPPTVVQLHASAGQIDFYDPKIDSQLQANFIRLLETGLLSNADELQTYSQSNAQEWQKLTNRNVNYIPPALPVQSINQPLKKSDYGLVVGRIQYWKGVTVLCEALRLLGDKTPNINWIGRDTVYRDSKRSMSAYLEQNYGDIWRKKVKPIGTFSPEETSQLQSSAKFIVVPSKWDVFNYTCAEAMAQGKTVLCSNGAGAVDLITDGVNGLTFTAGDSDNLAAKLETLLSWSDTKLQKVGQAARETIQVKLSPEKIAEQRIKRYRELIQQEKLLAPPNHWLIEAVSPSKSTENPLALLDRLPLKELSNYLLKRTMNKVLN